MTWTIIRWLVSLAAVACSLLVMNYAAYDAWKTAALPGNEFPEAWKWEAFELFWQSIALLAVAVLAAINIRPRWPYLRTKWTAFFTLVVIFGVVFPRAAHFIEIESCFDIGGRWDHESQVCKR